MVALQSALMILCMLFCPVIMSFCILSRVSLENMLSPADCLDVKSGNQESPRLDMGSGLLNVSVKAKPSPYSAGKGFQNRLQKSSIKRYKTICFECRFLRY